LSRFFVSICLFLSGLMAACGGDELPPREQIPVLRSRLFALQKGLSERNRGAIDSLLSVDILDIHQDSDSLLRFVYGSDGDFPFSQLGDYTIFFSNKLAVIDCFVMDSTARHDRPLRLIYKLDNDQWLLKEFRAGVADSASRHGP
jgi:hypothetical protein